MNKKQKIAVSRDGHPLPRVRSFSGYFLRAAALVLVLSVVGLPVNFALGGTSDSVVSALLEAGEIMSLLCLVFAWLARRGEKKAIHQLLTERQTVHWTYTPAEWQHLTTRAWRRSIRSNLIVTGIVWVVLGGALLANFSNVSSALALGTGVAVLLGLLLFLMAFVKLQVRRRRSTSDVYISRTGLILHGWYYAMSGWTGGLHRITYKAGDLAMLSFDIGWGRSRRVLTVPVPHGHERDAQLMAW